MRDHALPAVVSARYAGQMLIVMPFVWRGLGPRFWRTRQPTLQLVQSTMLLVATMCFGVCGCPPRPTSFGRIRAVP